MKRGFVGNAFVAGHSAADVCIYIVRWGWTVMSVTYAMDSASAIGGVLWSSSNGWILRSLDLVGRWVNNRSH